MDRAPERITVKRRRDEDPVETLCIQSKRHRTSVVWQRITASEPVCDLRNLFQGELCLDNGPRKFRLTKDERRSRRSSLSRGIRKSTSGRASALRDSPQKRSRLSQAWTASHSKAIVAEQAAHRLEEVEHLRKEGETPQKRPLRSAAEAQRQAATRNLTPRSLGSSRESLSSLGKQWDPDSEELLSQLQEFALSQSGHSEGLKFPPKPPPPRRIAAAVEEDEFVYDVYEQVKEEGVLDENCGIIIMDDEESFCSSDDEFESDDENAEDYHTNDYPEDESDLECSDSEDYGYPESEGGSVS